MLKINEIVESQGWYVFDKYIYNWGLSTTIIGGVFILNSWNYGNLIFAIGGGMLIVAYFFAMFYTIDEDLDWTLVYPQLAEVGDQVGGGELNTVISNCETDMLNQHIIELKRSIELIKNKSGKI